MLAMKIPSLLDQFSKTVASTGRICIGNDVEMLCPVVFPFERRTFEQKCCLAAFVTKGKTI